MTTLTQDEINRYSRHIILPEVGPKGQEKLKASSVFLVGTGGLGSPMAMYLAAAGVGRIGLIDFDVVEESNLQRQIVHGTSNIGQSKLQSAAACLRDINPHVQLDLFEETLTSENALRIFKNYDVIADGTDNFPTRYLVNDACVLTGKPNVYGSIFRFEGQLSVFNYKGGPCYRCLYNEPPPPGLVPSCAEGGVLGVLPGVVGTLQANEVLKVLLEIGEVASERLVMYDALKMKFRELKLRRDPKCPVCSESPSVTELIDYQEFCGIPQAKEKGDEADMIETDFDEISVEDLKAKIDAEEVFVLVDVREPHEAEICKIEGAQLIPLNTVESHLSGLDKSANYIIHCKMGGRSANACKLFKAAGFENVVNVVGGINAWAQRIDTTQPTY